jgi:type II restriction enzyme
VLSVIRKEGKEDLFFDIDEEKDQILVRKGHETLDIIPIYKISSKLAIILEKMKKGASSKGSFHLSEAEFVMKTLHCTKITASSNKKADISLKIEDPNTGTQPTQGFSMKSKIGGLSTILNASGATNFEYEIIQKNKLINPKSKPLIDLDRLLSDGESLKFVGIPNLNFRNNLFMIDSRMPELMGEMLKGYYLGLGSSLIDLTNYIENQDPLNMGTHKHFYEHKIEELLLAVAFGMQPSTPWTGAYEAHGGYIIVKENGELACYHVYDRDRFKKFLYCNTKFDTPSRSRHKFGKIYEKNGKKFILLNLQIRFNLTKSH